MNFQGSTTISNSFNSGSMNSKFKGLVKENTFKKLRNLLFRLFDYIAIVAPQMRGLQAFVSIWRIIQLLGPSLCVGSTAFWGVDTNMRKTMDIVSILFFIFPGNELRKRVAAYFLIAEGCFFLLLIIFVFISAIYYEKNAQLPNIIPTLIFFIFSTFGYILPPIGMNFIGELVGHMIDDHSNVTFDRIFGIVFALTTFFLFMLIFTLGYSVTINFRSDSLMTIVPTNQSIITSLLLIITFLPACGSHISGVMSTVIFNLLSSVSYVISIVLFFSNGGFVRLLHLEAMVATAVTGIIFSILVSIFELTGLKASEAVIIFFIVVWIVVFFVTKVIFNKLVERSLILLDSILEDPINFDLIKNPRKLCSVVVDGFRNAHPICLSFKLFKMAIERWPKSYNIWLLFAKFSAIYPEENQQLSLILVSMVNNKMKGSFAKHTMQQIESIIRQREPNLVPELKRKLDGIGRKVQTTKAKIRYIWDLVLQGNVSELEPIISRAHQAITATDISYRHLLSMFPNNRFVARAYARFLRDVVADHEGHSEWVQKVYNLQRGILVTSDLSHDLGLLAFPLLPKQLEAAQNIQVINPAINATEDTLTQEIEGDDEKTAIDAEMKSSIKESINVLSIPSYKQAKILHVTAYICLFLIPFIGVAVGAPIFISETTSGLDYLFGLSRLRATLFQGFGVMVHYIGENLNLSYPIDSEFPGKVVFPFDKYEVIGDTLEQYENASTAWGSTFDSKEQLRSISKDVTSITSQLQPMQSYKIGNPEMDTVRNILFNPSLNYTHFSSPKYTPEWDELTNNYSTINYVYSIEEMSIIDASILYASYFEEILILPTVPKDIFNQRYFVTPGNNLQILSDSSSRAITLMLEYFTALNKNIQEITFISMIAIILAVIIIYICITVYIISSMKHNKTAIYRCLTTLQKSVVSHVAEQLKILRKEESEERSSRTNDEELSRQEENLLKLFSTSSDSGTSKTFDNIINIGLSLFFVTAHVVMTIYLIICFRKAGDQLDQTTPHIDHIYGSYSFIFASVILLHLFPGAVYPSVNFECPGFDKDSILAVIEEWQTKGQEEFNLVKYGDNENNSPSFASLGIDINSIVDSAVCDNNFNPSNFHEVYNCMTPEAAMSFLEMLLNNLINVYQYSPNHEIFAGNDTYLTHIWHINMVHILDRYYYKLFSEISGLVVESMKARIPAMNASSFTVLAVILIFLIMYIYALNKSEERQRYALSLLLHCPGKVVMSNANVTAILTGNFKSTSLDYTTRDADFYENLVEEMPDAMIILKTDGTIVSLNKSTERIFQINREEMVGQSIVKLGDIFANENPFKDTFSAADKKPFERDDLIIMKDGVEHWIEMQFVVMAEWTFVDARDITQNVMYNKLIQEEKMKSDKLLSSILPPKLVSRVAAGEKDISFAVQSVTIVFMDIVSFTPWCGSLPAATVMSTLNMLFKEFDALTQMHVTMTKIKCIGDCYMGAGGIFMDVNQPTAHAKDVVEFGLDAIDAVGTLNEKIGQSLRIRVGVNTGGPIVAGVLGTEKPTFEILGPTINMAQQMEHHGVPMKVHISRAVYELIYGGNFKIQERGEVEIKNGNTVTYLVERK
ncbi:Adenylate and Guanylate cyclase catalytic domain containing protein [Tritrichomonas foetus]|uniref:Adenylate and Guanylate cyclase catalytic domain containing protein n=1 Tax=Tritrichomonas foetus TaxID=1144522 RepID=A0A1J4KTT4_9EUKA|nr:Adenylate and Guanylate cyclase catalytic domain containing protein [Tritrichomonas foetus]|eukprot:OHT14671.1 Adenylate and Guanylate cyclase catalytic domain containing protein [Tritrichomonas foetus]